MLLLISKFVNSQAAALVAFVPLALGIGVDPAIILAFASACYGYLQFYQLTQVILQQSNSTVQVQPTLVSL